MRVVWTIIVVFIFFGASIVFTGEAQIPADKPTKKDAEAARNTVIEHLRNQPLTTFSSLYDPTINLETGRFVITLNNGNWFAARLTDLDPNRITTKEVNRDRGVFFTLQCINDNNCVQSQWAQGKIDSSISMGFYLYKVTTRMSGSAWYWESVRDREAEEQVITAFRTLILYCQSERPLK